jgi:hypothetical protein
MMPYLPPAVDTQIEVRNYNVPLYGIRGEFSLSSTVKVPYFTCLMELNRVTGELKTHEEVSPSLETTYSLLELFQRQIDFERVKREIVDGYLRVPNKIKFFNSLTIVLLPKDEHGKITAQFEKYQNNDPPIPDAQYGAFDPFFKGDTVATKAVFGGVQFVHTKTENLSRLRWDLKRVDAVAVDGQHRLRALKLWMDSKNNQLSEIERPTRIPVIFLLLHEDAGFITGGKGVPSGIKGIAREIFTDLNKNAREVDLATQIILDDLSLESCCVRALITPTTCTDDTQLLPLTLLRWQEANNRFDQNYYLNSLVNLHLLVKDLLGLKLPEPMSKTEVRSFIARVSSTVGTGSPRALIHNGVSLDEYYTKNFFDGDEEEPIAPFSGIPPHYLQAAVDGFMIHFGPWLLSILTRFAPYSRLIEYARQNNLITGQFGQYLSQPKSHQEQLAKDLAYQHGEQWRKILIDDHVAAIEGIKGDKKDGLGDDWSFKTIFQKAIVRLGRQLFAEAPDDERRRFGTVSDYLEFLGRLHGTGKLRVLAPLPKSEYSLWTFIAVNYGSKKIRVSTVSEQRILDYLTILYFCVRHAKESNKKIVLHHSPAEGEMSVPEILKYFGTNSAQTRWPKIKGHIEGLLELFSGESVARVISGKPNPGESVRSDVARRRLEEIVLEGLNPFVNPTP